MARDKPDMVGDEGLDIVRRTVGEDGRARVTGGSGLHDTAAYTREFGFAVARLHYDMTRGSVLVEDSYIPPRSTQLHQRRMRVASSKTSKS
eukprot:10023094-Alexandrium_andersonii.AAC.1